jgi:hypothetical protein
MIREQVIGNFVGGRFVARSLWGYCPDSVLLIFCGRKKAADVDADFDADADDDADAGADADSGAGAGGST